MWSSVRTNTGHERFFYSSVDQWPLYEVIHLIALKYHWALNDILSLPVKEIDWFFQRLKHDIDEERRIIEGINSGNTKFTPKK